MPAGADKGYRVKRVQRRRGGGEGMDLSWGSRRAAALTASRVGLRRGLVDLDRVRRCAALRGVVRLRVDQACLDVPTRATRVKNQYPTKDPPYAGTAQRTGQA